MNGWQNWAHTEHASPRRIDEPRYVEDIVQAVHSAVRDGHRVKAIGSGHSFSGVAVADGVQLDLRRMNAITQIDGNLVTVQPGITLHELNTALDTRGLGLTNLGDIDRQTLAGAISTGTHGTGARFGGLATQVRGLELVLADGSMLQCGPTENSSVFAAARIGLGSLGIITSVTLACEPAYDLHAVQGPMPLQEIFDNLESLVDNNDHFEFYFFPYARTALAKFNNRVAEGTPPKPVGRVRAWFDDELLSNRLLDLTCRLCSRWPRITPRVNRLAAGALSGRDYVDRSYRVFCSSRKVVFREMEYAVPRAMLPSVFDEIRDWMEKSDEFYPFPTLIRFAAPDDIWLSTAYERETAYLSVNQYHRLSHEKYFRAVESIATAAGGRPHWGKQHWLGADQLRELFPRFDDFVQLRSRLDPNGLFANPYLTKVLGKVTQG